MINYNKEIFNELQLITCFLALIYNEKRLVKKYNSPQKKGSWNSGILGMMVGKNLITEGTKTRNGCGKQLKEFGDFDNCGEYSYIAKKTVLCKECEDKILYSQKEVMLKNG